LGLDPPAGGIARRHARPPHRRARHRDVPGRAADVPRDDGAREPAHGRIHTSPPGSRGQPRGSDAALPAAARACPPAGRDAVGRRAGDGRDRTRAAGAAEAVHLRRTLARHRTAGRRRDRADAAEGQAERGHHPARGAGRLDGAAGGRPRLRARGGDDRPPGPVGRARQGRQRPQRLPGFLVQQAPDAGPGPWAGRYESWRHEMRKFWSTLAIAGAMAAFAGSGMAAEKTVVLGISDALSGGGAVYGVPQKRAIDLAIEEINSAGGFKVGNDTVKFDTIAYDDKADPTEATNVARKLIDRDGVKFLLGYCCSASTGAVACFIGREDVIMLVGTAGARAITAAGNRNVFRTRPPGDYTGAAAGAFIASQGVKKLGVLAVRDNTLFVQYREEMLKAFKAAGGEVVAVETFGGHDRDMTAQLTKLRGLQPDALFISGYVEQAAFSHRQAHELGIGVPRYGFSGGSPEQFLKVATNEQMEGAWDLLSIEFNAEVLGPVAQAFEQRFKARYGEPPSPNSAFAYDQVYVPRDALQAAGTTTDLKKIREAIANLPVPKEALLKYLPIDGKMFDGKGQ